MDARRRETLVDLLRRRGVNAPCPRCGHLHYSILGEGNLQVSAGGGLLGDFTQDLPTVVLGCANCGFITQHALPVLEDRRAEPLIGAFRNG
jgi:bacterioferritin-associated ferredoxin